MLKIDSLPSYYSKTKICYEQTLYSELLAINHSNFENCYGLIDFFLVPLKI